MRCVVGPMARPKRAACLRKCRVALLDIFGLVYCTYRWAAVVSLPFPGRSVCVTYSSELAQLQQVLLILFCRHARAGPGTALLLM